MLWNRAEGRFISFYELFLKIVFPKKCNVSFCKSSDAINRLAFYETKAVAHSVFIESLPTRSSRQCGLWSPAATQSKSWLGCDPWQIPFPSTHLVILSPCCYCEPPADPGHNNAYLPLPAAAVESSPQVEALFSAAGPQGESAAAHPSLRRYRK